MRALGHAPDDAPTTDPCERVKLLGHDCPGRLLCFEVECRECGALLHEHAPVETIRQYVKVAVDGHDCEVEARSTKRRRRPRTEVAVAS